MMVRQPRQQETFRGRNVPKNAQLVLSPWHLHRHERLWERPDEFDPGRWDSEAGKASASKAYIPFSAGQRVCPGAGFAMLEGVLMLSRITAAYHLTPTDQTPVPVARLTVRGRNGIMLRLTPAPRSNAPLNETAPVSRATRPAACACRPPAHRAQRHCAWRSAPDLARPQDADRNRSYRRNRRLHQ